MVTVMIRPEDVDDVHVGMKAQVRLSGLNQRWHSPLPATVVVVSADRIDNERTGQSAYRVDLRIDPKELTKLKHGATITPGMPAQAMIVSGERTVMGSLISPVTDTLHDALRQQ
jgi:multidrug efflux pump subunit AcrA (membrane-fusion protein)